MIGRLRFCVAYFAFWMLFYAVARVAFLVYHHAETARAGFGTLVGIITHGTRMDLPVSAAPCLLVFPLMAVSAFAPRIAARLIAGLTAIVLVLASLLVFIDVELFRAWGFRIDGSILQYFKTPGEMLASTGASPVVLLTILFLLMATGSIYAFFRWFWPGMRAWEPLPLPWNLAAIPIAGALVGMMYVPLHGGVQKHPIKQSTVFFSHNAFANQATLNVTWNFLDGVWQKGYRTDNPYLYLPADESLQVTDSLLDSGGIPPRKLLRIAHPNVMIIIWESLTAKIVERLGGVPGVTPQLDSLIHEGILFDHFYATGDRSPEGLTGVIAGYPAQPTSEIIQLPRKVATLPGLPRELHAAGYQSRFFYGGDPAFASFKAFAMETGFDSLVTEDQFSASDRHTHWGTDDHVVLARALGDMRQMPRPFFVTLFTLSSHEPFVVPMTTMIAGSDERSLFLNAHYYTDRSIGDFVRNAKREPWWDSTLVVIVADHGHRLPQLDSLQPDRKWETFAIPMIWLGGALAVRDTVISHVGAQTDIPATLLHQLGLDATRFRWSRDMLAPGARPWAWFSFSDGFGFTDSSGTVVWDNIGRRVIAETGGAGAREIRSGQALLQQLINDYVKR